MQSLPPGSHYQIIELGSDYEKYDQTPKEYTQTNIKKSIKFIETLKADKGWTDIYAPLNDIYTEFLELFVSNNYPTIKKFFCPKKFVINWNKILHTQKTG